MEDVIDKLIVPNNMKSINKKKIASLSVLPILELKRTNEDFSFDIKQRELIPNKSHAKIPKKTKKNLSRILKI